MACPPAARPFTLACLLTLTGLGLGWLGCGQATQPHGEPLSLSEAFPGAEVRLDSGGLDLLGTAVGRQRLTVGWEPGGGGRDGQGPRFWGTGSGSEIELDLLPARDLELVLVARPFAFPGAPRQEMTVAAGGRIVERLELSPELERYRVSIPAAALATGRNLVRFEYAYSRRPSEVLGTPDHRRLAVAFYELRLGSRVGSESAPRVEGDRLILPAGSQVDYFLPLRGPSTWTATAVAASPGVELEMTLTPEGEEERPLLPHRGDQTVLSLPGEGSRLARVRLQSLASGGEGAGGDVVVDSPAVWTGPAPTPPPKTDRPAAVAVLPDIVLYVIDTLRADRLGCYGYPRDVSPRIDALAAESTRFARLQAQSSWTRASMASILTGLGPESHGANRRLDVMSARFTTLAEHLGAAGYDTGGFVTNSNVSEVFGFRQGFGRYQHVGAEEVVDLALEWLAASRAPATPRLAYVHNIDPHAPYEPPEGLRRRLAPATTKETAAQSLRLVDRMQSRRLPRDPASVAALSNLYDAEVAFADQELGRFVDGLRELGAFDGALLIVVSDHGEEFLEHDNFQHGRSLYEESIHVPLIVKWPGQQRGAVVEEPVQHIDLLPTILEAAGLAGAADLPGRPLPVPQAAPGSERPLFSYLHLDGPAKASVRLSGWKLIARYEGERLFNLRLYDLERDPGERANRVDDHPVRAGYLLSLLRMHLALAGTPESETAVLDDELRRSLEALGYL